MTNSPEYEAAREAHNIAYAKYTAAAEDYRAMKIGDEEFIAAHTAKKEADRAFDIAFEAEANR